MRDEGVLLPIVESGARYFQPLLHDDEIAVAASVVHVGNSSLRIGYRIERAGERTTEGFEVRVFPMPACDAARAHRRRLAGPHPLGAAAASPLENATPRFSLPTAASTKTAPKTASITIAMAWP